MARKGVELLMGPLLVLVALSFHGAVAQSGCTSMLMGLMPCLNYVTGNASTPSSTCCSQLAGVVQTQPQCLCALVNGGASQVGITINQTLALALSGACSVQTPPVSQCAALTPSSPPTSSPPSDSAGNTPDTGAPTSSIPSTPAGAAVDGGSKAVPSPPANGSGSIKVSFAFLLLPVLVASYSPNA